MIGEMWIERRKTCFWVLSVLISLSLLGGCGIAQTKQTETTAVKKYPEKPITVIVPFSAGGALDMVAQSMEKKSILISRIRKKSG